LRVPGGRAGVRQGRGLHVLRLLSLPRHTHGHALTGSSADIYTDVHVDPFLYPDCDSHAFSGHRRRRRRPPSTYRRPCMFRSSSRRSRPPFMRLSIWTWWSSRPAPTLSGSTSRQSHHRRRRAGCDHRRAARARLYFQNGEGRDSVLIGFTIRNGSSSTGARNQHPESLPLISGNTIEDNLGCSWRESTSTSDPYIEDNTIRGNRQTTCSGGPGGGGIYRGREELRRLQPHRRNSIGTSGRGFL
jgi:hypothetical protein